MSQETHPSRVAIITGASSGIGEATALKLADAGIAVVLAARRMERLEALHKKITDAGGSALMVETDVTSRAQVEAMETVDAFGRVDILINNAGVMLLSYMRNAHVDEWERMIDVNLKGPLFGIGAVMPIMKEQGSGHIINVSSMAGRRVFPSGAVYCGTKFGLHAITEGLRQELGHKNNIRATIIAPGVVATELTHHITDDDVSKRVDAMTSMDALTSEDIANAILYAIEQPAHVNVSEVLVLPTAQG
jgi:NADP-dependent 3-hydroxy acid dehydrogenase YdfG